MTVMERVDYYARVGQAIRDAREERGWSQLRLATALELTTGVAVHYWERGVNRPDAWTLDRLERLFGRRLRP
jgi:ribosome-binding protein aMBF1 (putative translation factor)